MRPGAAARRSGPGTGRATARAGEAGLAAAYLRAEVVELARYPGYVVPTICFPALFFLFFGQTAAGGAAAGGAGPGGAGDAAGAAAAGSLAGYMAFAVFGVVFFQFGVGIAQERAGVWQLYLRTLPVRPWQRFAARLGAAAVFGTLSAAAVLATAAARGPLPLGAGEGLRLAAALAAGAVPFGLLGIALGYLLSPKAALPLANLLYLALSYLGGMWTGPGGLHGAARALSAYLPTRRWDDLVAGAAGAGAWQPAALAWLGGWAALFALAARWAYRRDEVRHFR